MNKWKNNDLGEIEVKIKIPKGCIAFIVNTLSKNNEVITMGNTQYDSKDIEKLTKDSDINE